MGGSGIIRVEKHNFRVFLMLLEICMKIIFVKQMMLLEFVE